MCGGQKCHEAIYIPFDKWDQSVIGGNLAWGEGGELNFMV